MPASLSRCCWVSPIIGLGMCAPGAWRLRASAREVNQPLGHLTFTAAPGSVQIQDELALVTSEQLPPVGRGGDRRGQMQAQVGFEVHAAGTVTQF